MKTKASFWRRTPPALFPGLLGLLGLSLFWTQATTVWGMPVAIGNWIGVIGTALFLAVLVCYMMKLIARPSVLWDDLKIGPARGAVSAGSMCAMALAVIILPITISGAWLVWWLGVGLHVLYLITLMILILRNPDPIHQVTPVMMLPLVGILVATLAAPSFGYDAFVWGVLIVTVPLAAAVGVMSVLNARANGVLVAQRSSFVIFLAPPSIAALAVALVGGQQMFFWCWLGASLVALGLIAASWWVCVGKWTPGWGAFTFPLTAFGTMQLVAVEMGFGLMASIPAVVTLILASFIVPYVVFRTFVCWGQGKLADMTKAAVA